MIPKYVCILRLERGPHSRMGGVSTASVLGLGNVQYDKVVKFYNCTSKIVLVLQSPRMERQRFLKSTVDKKRTMNTSCSLVKTDNFRFQLLRCGRFHKM